MEYNGNEGMTLVNVIYRHKMAMFLHPEFTGFTEEECDESHSDVLDSFRLFTVALEDFDPNSKVHSFLTLESGGTLHETIEWWNLDEQKDIDDEHFRKACLLHRKQKLLDSGTRAEDIEKQDVREAEQSDDDNPLVAKFMEMLWDNEEQDAEFAQCILREVCEIEHNQVERSESRESRKKRRRNSTIFVSDTIFGKRTKDVATIMLTEGFVFTNYQ